MVCIHVNRPAMLRMRKCTRRNSIEFTSITHAQSHILIRKVKLALRLAGVKITSYAIHMESTCRDRNIINHTAIHPNTTHLESN